jgi:hypothetical protein
METLHDWIHRARKVGFGISLFVVVIQIYGLIRLLALDMKQMTSGHWFDLLFLLAYLALGFMFISQDQKLWKAWATVFASPSIVLLTGFLPVFSLNVHVAIRLISILLAAYSFGVFWKYCRQDQR